MDAREILAGLRDGQTPGEAALRWFAEGLASGAVTDAQAGAFAMAVCQRGIGRDGRVALTKAMRDTGKTLRWKTDKPVIDKHSTGGIGDCVSLLLAPVLAELGGFVPMISGRGLGHTGGTLDKLEAIPGLTVDQSLQGFRKIVDDVGCAIVSASEDLAPADRRLYAVRDVTSTVESIDLITASILSKKLAAGLEHLILDVKTGSGAFMAREEDARDLARSLVETANGAGCHTGALLTNMDQPVASAVGNAVEIVSVMEALTEPASTRLEDVTAALCGDVLAMAGLAPSADEGRKAARACIGDGRALERFCRMVAAQGGPRDFGRNWKSRLPVAPVHRDVPAPEAGYLTAMDARGLGECVVHLGGGRLKATDKVDPSVGLSHMSALGDPVDRGAPLMRIHAGSNADADRAEAAVLQAITIGPDPVDLPPLISGRVGP